MKCYLLLIVLLFFGMNADIQEDTTHYIHFAGGCGQVELGGPFVGFESHNSFPLPIRISFYYPVANSIDLSTDYWHREQSRPMYIGLKIGDAPKLWIGLEPYEHDLTPYSVSFGARFYFATKGDLKVALTRINTIGT